MSTCLEFWDNNECLAETSTVKNYGESLTKNAARTLTFKQLGTNMSKNDRSGTKMHNTLSFWCNCSIITTKTWKEKNLKGLISFHVNSTKFCNPLSEIKLCTHYPYLGMKPCKISFLVFAMLGGGGVKILYNSTKCTFLSLYFQTAVPSNESKKLFMVSFSIDVWTNIMYSLANDHTSAISKMPLQTE